MVVDYPHTPGDHCGSASLRNVADHYEWGFDEAACFGIGAGIGFSYATYEAASRMIMGRNAHLDGHRRLQDER